jgi:hypothetical protein
MEQIAMEDAEEHIPIGERRGAILALNTAARNTMLHAGVGIVDEVELRKLRD